MQVPIDQISFEQQVGELGRVFADCTRKEFEDVLPNATVTIYVKQPKCNDQGGGESGIRYDISDDSVSEETLEYQMDSRRDVLIQRFLDTVSANYRDSRRYRGHDRSIRFLGRVLEVKDLVTGPTEHFDFDESDFQEIAEFALKKNWFYTIEIDKYLVVEVMKLTRPFLLKLIEEHGSEFIEFINL